jgi:hypothetical protein
MQWRLFDIRTAVQHLYQSIDTCGALHSGNCPQTSPSVLHAVVRTEDGRTFPHSFVPEKQVKHKCAGGRFPCASSFSLFIKANFVSGVLCTTTCSLKAADVEGHAASAFCGQPHVS